MSVAPETAEHPMVRETARHNPSFLPQGAQESFATPTRALLKYLLDGWRAQEAELLKLAAQEEREDRRQFTRGMIGGLNHAAEDLEAALRGHVFPGFGAAPGLERVWLLRLIAREGGQNEPRRQVEGVALSELDARLWRSESGEYDNQAEEVPVWHPAMMTVSGDADLDNPDSEPTCDITDLHRYLEK